MALKREIAKGLAKLRRQPLAPPVTTGSLLRLDLSNAARLFYQKRIYDRISHLPGDVVECGVGWGKTLTYWALICHDGGDARRIWGFDSFEGFPTPTSADAGPRNPQKGEWNEVSLDGVLKLLQASGLSPNYIRSKITLVQGFFEQSLEAYTGDEIALLHIDADLYASYRTVLHSLYDKVVPGGIIAFDEYMGTREFRNWPGAKKAIDEFFQDRQDRIERDFSFGKYYAVKAA